MNANTAILVGVDGSAASNQAVRWAAENAMRRGTSLQLVATRFVAGTYGVPIGLPPSYFDDQEREGERTLAHASALARDVAESTRTDESPQSKPLTIECELVTGHPVPVLLDRAASARMVVVGSRGIGEVTGDLLGAVGPAVAAHAPCPVAVVPARSDGVDALGGPVVVGVAGAPGTDHVLTEAFTEASLRGTELIAVHAWSDTAVANVFSRNQGLEWTSIRTREEAALAEALAGHAANFPDVKVRRTVVEDRPARTLTELANLAQLVVVGCRGRGGFASMLLGSTSRSLLHSVTCPLLIVHTH